MNLRIVISIAAAFCLLFATIPVGAQSQRVPEENLNELRQRIEQMEAMDLGDMAASTLEIYQRTLLRLYERTLPQLEQQIDRLVRVPANNSEASTVRAQLEKERAKLVRNSSILRISLGLRGDASVAAQPGTRSTNEPPSRTNTPQLGAATDREAGNGRSTSQPEKIDNAAIAPAPRQPSSGNAGADRPLNAQPGVQPAAAPAAAAAPQPPCAYPNVPPVLQDEVTRLAQSIMFNNDPEEISGQNYKLVFYTIADALNVQVPARLPNEDQTKTISFEELEPYRYLGETARTDKQLGASSSTAASVSAVDKPGFAWLLGFGIENGLVEQDVRDTVLTLSTSPAALYMLDRDARNPYQRAGFLNRIGVAASFNIANRDTLLGNVTREQLREYSVKYRFVGDRSARSRKLEALWDSVAKDIQERLRALNNAAIFISRDPVLRPIADQANPELQLAVTNVMNSDAYKNNAPTATDTPTAAQTKRDAQAKQISDAILCYLRTKVFSQKDKLSADASGQFKQVLVPNLVAAQLNLKVVREAFNKRLDEFFQGPLGTFAYINHREPVLGNYSEFKFLFEHPTPILDPLAIEKLTANAGFSFYHRPNAALKQERIRGVNAAISFEGSMSAPFTETADLSRITFSFVGRYERLLENRVNSNRNDLATAQFLMNIPLFKGMGFPFSLSYSNATELDRQRGWRANFGLKLDTDKLLELVRASTLR